MVLRMGKDEQNGIVSFRIFCTFSFGEETTSLNWIRSIFDESLASFANQVGVCHDVHHCQGYFGWLDTQ